VKNPVYLLLIFFFGFGIVLGLRPISSQAQNANAPTEHSEPIPCLFIHKIAINAKYQRDDRNPPPIYRYALIRGCAKNKDEHNMAVQVLVLKWKGELQRTAIYEVKKVFINEEEASAYSFMNNIPITSNKEGHENELFYLPNLRENGKLSQDIRVDSVIQAIEKALPSDWELIQTEKDKKEFPEKFTLRAKYQVWETGVNLVNAPISLGEQVSSPEYYKKVGKKITPFIRFTLHQPWRKIELENIDYDENTWEYYYANAQYFGLKVADFAGIGGKYNQIHLPDNVKITPFQVYDKIYQFLKPQEIIGTARRAKLGDIIHTENGEVYYIEDNGLWKPWTDEEIGKKVKVKGTLLTPNSDWSTRNEKGELTQGLDGEINLLFRPERQLYEQATTIIGKLQTINESNIGKSTPSGYGLLTDDRKFYYLEGLENWNLKEKFIGKRMKITGIYTEKRNGQDIVVIEPTLTQLQLPELEKSISLVVVFKKNEVEEPDELLSTPSSKSASNQNASYKVMQYTDYPFWEGMDSSKRKAYFYKTGEKYHVIFPSEEEKQNFIQYLKNKPEIYEVYKADWNIRKD
jgi:hypothetical protein